MSALKSSCLIAVALAIASGTAAADPSSGVDSELFRASYDTTGVFALDGARLMPKRDMSFKLWLSYGHAPLQLNVPGIGSAGKDKVLDYLVTIDMAFGMTVSDRIAIGLDVAGYRTATGAGYGDRGLYRIGGQPDPLHRSTGLIALRPLSNIDPSATGANALSDGLAGPLDARFGLKVALLQRPLFAISLIGSVFLPFGDDQMVLGDANVVFEPKLAVDWRPDRIHATRVVGNVGARIRQRTVLESYDATTAGTSPADAKVIYDSGSELVVGLGGLYELGPRLVAGLEAQLFVPLPDGASWGSCYLYSLARCSSLTSADYFTDAKHGDFAALITAGVTARVSPDLTANLMVGSSPIGARGDDVRVTAGVVWAPQPGGSLVAGRNDRDGDGVPDSVDACPDEPEDKDGFQDEDGCPDLDNDRDGIPDAVDKCPNEPEDKDGFEDEDGCPDDDNDGDGIADKDDKCPNDPETVNGFEDDDGCPDVRGATGPQERADRLDLQGAGIAFRGGALTPQARGVLNQIATLIKSRRLAIRVEVHTALGTRSSNAGTVAAQKRRDKVTAQQRAKIITDYLVGQGVSPQQLQAVAIGSDRPFGTANPADPVNERVDFIKAQQGGAP